MLARARMKGFSLHKFHSLNPFLLYMRCATRICTLRSIFHVSNDVRKRSHAARILRFSLGLEIISLESHEMVHSWPGSGSSSCCSSSSFHLPQAFLLTGSQQWKYHKFSARKFVTFFNATSSSSSCSCCVCIAPLLTFYLSQPASINLA